MEAIPPPLPLVLRPTVPELLVLPLETSLALPGLPDDVFGPFVFFSLAACKAAARPDIGSMLSERWRFGAGGGGGGGAPPPWGAGGAAGGPGGAGAGGWGGGGGGGGGGSSGGLWGSR